MYGVIGVDAARRWGVEAGRRWCWWRQGSHRGGEGRRGKVDGVVGCSVSYEQLFASCNICIFFGLLRELSGWWGRLCRKSSKSSQSSKARKSCKSSKSSKSRKSSQSRKSRKSRQSSQSRQSRKSRT